MAIENRLRQRLDLQQTRRQQLQFKEAKRQAEREEEEEFRRKVLFESIFDPFRFAMNLCRCQHVDLMLKRSKATRIYFKEFDMKHHGTIC